MHSSTVRSAVQSCRVEPGASLELASAPELAFTPMHFFTYWEFLGVHAPLRSFGSVPPNLSSAGSDLDTYRKNGCGSSLAGVRFHVGNLCISGQLGTERFLESRVCCQPDQETPFGTTRERARARACKMQAGSTLPHASHRPLLRSKAAKVGVSQPILQMLPVRL
eukprot:2309272-Pleurochrysis_carterae.AAC.1